MFQRTDETQDWKPRGGALKRRDSEGDYEPPERDESDEEDMFQRTDETQDWKPRGGALKRRDPEEDYEPPVIPPV